MSLLNHYAIRSRLGVVNVMDYGAKGDGVTDDTAAIQSAVAELTSGKTLLLPGRHLVRLPSSVTTAQIGFLVDNLSDISIIGTIINDEFGLDDTNVWKSIASMSAVGTTVTVVTSEPHGRSVGSVIQIYADCDNAYNGTVTIASTPDANTFTYVTLGAPFTGSTPVVTPATGVMKYARPDFDRYLFRFTRCKNVAVDLNFEGQAVPWASNHRLGYQLLDYRQSGGVDNTIKDIKLRIRGGCSNGISGGFYQSSTIGHVSGGKVWIDAEDCGYPVSGWSCAFEGTHFDVTGKRVHRLIYLGGKKGGTIIGRVQDFTSSGVLLTTHFDGTNHFGVEDVYCKVTDTGTTMGIPWMRDPAQSVRFLVGINGSTGGGTPHYRNVTLECDLTVTDTIGRNIQAVRMFHSATEACIFSDITIKGSINRLDVTDLNLFADDSNEECFVRAYSNQETHNIFFESFRVKNSAAILAGTSGEKARFRRYVVLEGNSGLVFFINSTTTSAVSKLITGGTEKNFDTTALTVSGGAVSDGDIVLYSLGASPTVLRIALGGTLALSVFSTAITPQTTLVFDGGSPSQMFRDWYLQNIFYNVTTVTPGATTTISLAAGTGAKRTLDLTALTATTFETSNRGSGRSATIKVIAGASGCTLIFPAWVFVGGAAPASLAANKTAILRIHCWGNNDSDITAEWAVQA